jgi:hypothetical protein
VDLATLTKDELIALLTAKRAAKAKAQRKWRLKRGEKNS